MYCSQLPMRWKKEEYLSKIHQNHLTHQYTPMMYLLFYKVYLKKEPLELRFQILSSFSVKMAKDKVSFEQRCYQLQTLRKTYSNSVFRKGMQRSLKRVAVGTFNMGACASLDSIIKKFTIICGSVKSFNLLMRNFYRADWEKEESLHHLPTG